MKLMTIVGTRPELIRLSRFIQQADEFTSHILVHTGQNYDFELNEVFFDELEIRKPDYFLNVKSSSLGETIGKIIQESEKVIQEVKPDAIAILGDTNSALSAIIAKRMKIPIYHMESGNRSFDFDVPEEINRKMVDHLSDINFVYTEHGRRNLLDEAYPSKCIYLSGSPMKEILDHYKSKINQSTILESLNLKTNQFIVASVHREDNVDSKSNLLKIIGILNSIAEKYDVNIVVSTHPRTRKKLDDLKGELDLSEKVQYLKPFGFFDYVYLQQNAQLVISDSGTISEEASICGFKAITIRNSMERPEAMDCGNIVTTGLDEEVVLESVHYVLSTPMAKSIPSEYQVSDFSQRVMKVILGTYKHVHSWGRLTHLTNVK